MRVTKIEILILLDFNVLEIPRGEIHVMGSKIIGHIFAKTKATKIN